MGDIRFKACVKCSDSRKISNKTTKKLNRYNIMHIYHAVTSIRVINYSYNIVVKFRE